MDGHAPGRKGQLLRTPSGKPGIQNFVRNIENTPTSLAPFLGSPIHGSNSWEKKDKNKMDHEYSNLSQQLGKQFVKNDFWTKNQKTHKLSIIYANYAF